MGLIDRLLGRTPAQPPAEQVRLEDLVLRKLRPGQLVDFDGITWEVTAQARVECAERGTGGQRWTEQEWTLRSPEAQMRLRLRESYGQAEWELLSPLRLEEVDLDVRDAIARGQAPAPQGFFDDQPVFREPLEGAALYHRAGQSEEDGEFFWNYKDELGRSVLRVEQRGNALASVSLLTTVEEYQFTNILPGAPR